MALFTLKNTEVVGLSACVPKEIENNLDYEWMSVKERKMLVKTTGVESRRIAPKNITTTDLCEAAANKLFQSLDWKKEDIEALIFVSQSPDYFVPASSIILQNRLGLPHSCMAFDINLGCSGYVYGLSVAAGMVQSGMLKKVLLLVGDKSSSSLSKKDKSTYPLFGDAGTATALEYNSNALPMHFNLQSDGAGYESIIIRDGAVRNPVNENTFKDIEYGPGIIRNQFQLALNGVEITNFALREVKPNIEKLFSFSKHTQVDCDFFVMHQANKLMNERIRRSLNLDPEQVPYSLDKFGNTSSASIPLTMVTQLNEQLNHKLNRFLLSGFGVGLSWGSAIVSTNSIVCPPLVEI